MITNGRTGNQPFLQDTCAYNITERGGLLMITNKNYLAVMFFRIVALALCMSLAAGCTSLKPVTPVDPQAISEQIKPGDELILTTRDGREREFKVKESNLNQLVGENETVNLSDITNIERREFNKGKTAGLIGGIVGVAFAAALIALMFAFATHAP
jgi:hypothetical protein